MTKESLERVFSRMVRFYSLSEEIRDKARDAYNNFIIEYPFIDPNSDDGDRIAEIINKEKDLTIKECVFLFLKEFYIANKKYDK